MYEDRTKVLPLPTVTYYANGGDTDDNTGEFKTDGQPLDSTYTVLSDTDTDIKRDGYTFTGWNTQADGNGTSYDPQDSFTITDDVELYAQWEAIEYTVSYNSNGGSGSHTDTPLNYDDNYTVLSDTDTDIKRDGYTFTGWNTQADGNGTSYDPQNSFTIKDNVELHAQWEATEYTVTYNSNGGTGGYIDDNSGSGYIYADTYTVLSDTDTGISCSNYTFIGWNTQADGSGLGYGSNSQFTIEGDVTLYAQWGIKYVVSYNANGGTGAHEDQEIAYGTSYTIKTIVETGIVRDNYIFVGWNDSPDGTGTTYTEGEIITIDEDVILYAQWEEVSAPTPTYSVNYDANGGTGSYTDTPLYYDDNYTVLSDTATDIKRDGYTFTGWNTQADGTGTSYDPNGSNNSFTIKGDVELYAQWKAIEYTVTYDANGGTGSYTDTPLYYDDNYTVLSDTDTGISCSNHTFIGWNTQADGSGLGYGSNSQFTIEGDVTLYAQWGIKYVVSYNANGGTGAHEDQEIAYGTSYTIKTIVETGIVRDNYIFVGWNDSPDGTGTRYTEGEIITIEGDVILYAQWKEVPASTPNYSVNYNANGGIGSYTDANLEKDSKYIILKNDATGISYSGYTFKGWNTAADGTGTSYSARDTIVITGPITLYAQWQAATSTPTDANNITTSGGSTSTTKTGDNTNITFWASLFVISLSGIVVVTVIKRRKMVKNFFEDF